MSPNRRIVLNIFATYGRSALGILCGIFSTRWILMALGQEDFGLFGLVGSLTMFMGFFNIQLGLALGRFYAYSVGQANVAEDRNAALESCRAWFTTGVVIHTAVPLVLVAIGYPVGEWAIASGHVGVPAAKIDAAVWLWRFVAVSAFVSMATVPFNAMFTAKQNIAELTVYTILQALMRTAFAYYMVSAPGEWLVRYGLVSCVFSVLPNVIICLRALQSFPECRLRRAFLFSWPHVVEIGRYAWWQTFGGLGYMARRSGLIVIVTRFFGPRVTASYSVGVTVADESGVLTGALAVAFAPAITTSYGEGDIPRFRAMCYRACKFGTLLTLLPAIPMALEVSELLRLWLKEVPAFTPEICLVLIAVTIVEKLTIGQTTGINASGRIARYQAFLGLWALTAIPFALAGAFLFRHVVAVAGALLLTTLIMCCSNVWLARTRIGLSAWYWLKAVALPLFGVGLVSAAIGLLPRLFMDASFLRIVVTSACSSLPLVGLSFLFVLNDNEREFVMSRLCARLPILRKVGRRGRE